MIARFLGDPPNNQGTILFLIFVEEEGDPQIKMAKGYYSGTKYPELSTLNPKPKGTLTGSLKRNPKPF